jgi:hypothetical protein
MVDRQPSEAALELVPIVDLAQGVWRRCVVVVQNGQVWIPDTAPASLVVAGVDEEAVRPGLKAGRVAERGKVLPDREQRLLGRVLGQIHIAQDPMRDRVQPVAARHGKARECLAVARCARITSSGSPSLRSSPEWTALSQGYDWPKRRLSQSSNWFAARARFVGIEIDHAGYKPSLPRSEARRSTSAAKDCLRRQRLED